MNFISSFKNANKITLNFTGYFVKVLWITITKAFETNF
jgi:hypothetical protein